MFNRLGSLGIVERKSGKETIPEELPEEFLWSYICGLFDGDGSIYKRKTKNAGGFDWCISSSSKKLIYQLNEHIPFGIIKNNKNMWDIKVRNKPDIRKIRNKIYENISFCLERKRKIVDRV